MSLINFHISNSKSNIKGKKDKHLQTLVNFGAVILIVIIVYLIYKFFIATFIFNCRKMYVGNVVNVFL